MTVQADLGGPVDCIEMKNPGTTLPVRWRLPFLTISSSRQT